MDASTAGLSEDAAVRLPARGLPTYLPFAGADRREPLPSVTAAAVPSGGSASAEGISDECRADDLATGGAAVDCPPQGVSDPPQGRASAVRYGRHNIHPVEAGTQEKRSGRPGRKTVKMLRGRNTSEIRRERTTSPTQEWR